MKRSRRGKPPAATPLLAAIDCGTSAIKAGLIDAEGGLRAFAVCPAPLMLHKDGRVETDADMTLACALKCLADCAATPGVDARRVAGLAVTNQRATLVCSDGRGRATGPAIVWQDLRGREDVDAFRRIVPDRAYFQTTGLPNHPVFTLGKILWVRRQRRSPWRRARRFGLLQDYLLRAMGAEGFWCDPSNASLTGLLDVARLEWSEAILKAARLSPEELPGLVPSGRVVGALSAAAARATGLPRGVPLISGGGDQQCAGLGAGAAEAGVVVVCLGTAAAPLCGAERVRRDPLMRVTCCAHAIPGRWNVEGLQNCAGSALQWFRRATAGPGRFSREEMSEAGRVPPGARGALFYPYLDGAGAPHWDPKATGMFLGLRLTHDRATLLRAVMEGVSLETREILDVFKALKLPCREIRVTGGCSEIEVWDRILADVCGRPVCTLQNPHATLLGAAMLAAVGVGLHEDCASAARRMAHVRRRFVPDLGRAEEYDDVYRRFCEARRVIERGRLFDLLQESPSA